MERKLNLQFTEQEALTLWYMIQDILQQDANGRNSGQGGLIEQKSIGALFSVFTQLAERIDEHRKGKKKLEIVK